MSSKKDLFLESLLLLPYWYLIFQPTTWWIQTILWLTLLFALFVSVHVFIMDNDDIVELVSEFSIDLNIKFQTTIYKLILSFVIYDVSKWIFVIYGLYSSPKKI